MTPYESFIDWFSDLPLKYRQDLVSEIGAYLPGVEVNPFHREFLPRFFAQLDAIKKKGMQAELGLVICLKALMKQLVRIHVSASESDDWKKEKAALDEMAKLTGSCSLAEHASAKALHVSEWQAIASAWEKLESDGMSDVNIASSYPIAIK